jgi:putative ABC transport system substrate-binding protein
VIYSFRAFADLGGLLSYGSSILDLSQRAGIYVGKILKGAKPADLPIQQSTRVALAINLKSAKTLGITAPSEFLARADPKIGVSDAVACLTLSGDRRQL